MTHRCCQCGSDNCCCVELPKEEPKPRKKPTLGKFNNQKIIWQKDDLVVTLSCGCWFLYDKTLHNPAWIAQAIYPKKQPSIALWVQKKIEDRIASTARQLKRATYEYQFQVDQHKRMINLLDQLNS